MFNLISVIILSANINLGFISDLDANEVTNKPHTNKSEVLNDYYKEFNHISTSGVKCNCLEHQQVLKKDLLGSYYSEFIK